MEATKSALLQSALFGGWERHRYPHSAFGYRGTLHPGASYESRGILSTIVSLLRQLLRAAAVLCREESSACSLSRRTEKLLPPL